MKHLVRAVIMVPFTLPVVLTPFGLAARIGLCFVAMVASHVVDRADLAQARTATPLSATVVVTC